MAKPIFLFPLLVAVSTLSVLCTDSPVIGILAQEYVRSPVFHLMFPNHTSYIAASYVKMVESSGARVVPIMIGKDREYYVQILSQLNGILLPGGAANFSDSNGYADAGRHLIHLAEKLNANGEQIPVFAVCLGFELLLQVSAQDTDFRKLCPLKHINLNLKFLKGFRNSSLFHRAPPGLLEKLAKEPLTHNNHIWCIYADDMVAVNLTDNWKILSVSELDNYQFVSTVEHRKFPMVGVQFHPEKNAFEWADSQHNPHSPDAIKTARIFYDWLIEQSRKNNRSFGRRDLLYQNLIQNYELRNLYPHSSIFEQVYLFN